MGEGARRHDDRHRRLDEKAELAKSLGCTHTINYSRENFVEKTKELTGGKGVPVVYDGVGKDTFLGSLDCLSKFGLMVLFGNASGAVAAFNPGILAGKGSLYLTRPTLDTYAGRAPGSAGDGRRPVPARRRRQDQDRAVESLCAARRRRSPP
jgi:NADPH:quinone reductase-like Zn-dependent oxidoreductase